MKNKLVIYSVSLALGVIAYSAHSHESTAESQVDSLCSEQEATFFSCAISNSAKIVSLCGAKSADGSGSYRGVTYRFGRHDKVELEFPKKPNTAHTPFRYAHYMRYRTSRTEVSFSIGRYKYVLFDYYEGEEPPEEHALGITVLMPDRREKQYFCKDGGHGSLAKLRSFAVCDSENPLNMGDC